MHGPVGPSRFAVGGRPNPGARHEQEPAVAGDGGRSWGHARRGGVRAAVRPAPPRPPGSVNGPVSCPDLPADNIWNRRIDALPVSSASATYVNTVGAGAMMHADFGSGLWNGGPIGIPYVVVKAGQPKVAVTFGWPGESDRGPYPIPPNAPVEGGANSTGDRHVLVVDACDLPPLRALRRPPERRWQLEGVRGRGVRPAVQRAAAGHVDVGRRRRPADLCRPGALRRGGVRRHPPRHPHDRTSDPRRPRVAGPPRRLVAHRRAVPADGPALPPEGQLRRQHLLAPGPGDPPGDEDSTA